MTTAEAAETPPKLKPRHAFGVDPVRPQFYSLRQSRYDALAQDVSDWAGEAAAAGRRLRLLIIGARAGVELRHLEAKPHFEALDISGADLVDQPMVKGELYREFFVGDLMEGYPAIESGSYDVVVCEQVLEHLPRIETSITTLERVLKPGGRLLVGVPIFPPPLHLARRHVVPRMDAIFAPHRSRSHVQAFSLRTFLGDMQRNAPALRLLRARGFRIVSGGLLRHLDNYRWWWRLNRRLGALIPGACIEVQAIFEKPPEAGSGPGSASLRS